MGKIIKKISFLALLFVALFTCVSFADESAELDTQSNDSSGTGSSPAFGTGIDTGTSLTGTPDRWTKKYEEVKQTDGMAIGVDVNAPFFSASSDASPTPDGSPSPSPSAPPATFDSIDAPANGQAASPSPSYSPVMTGKSEVPGRWHKKYNDDAEPAKSQAVGANTKNKTKPARPGTQNIPMKNGQTVSGIILKDDKEEQGYLVDVGEGIKIFVRYDEIEWPKNADEKASQEEVLEE